MAESEIYTGNVYTPWLEGATEKDLFEEWMRKRLQALRLSGTSDRPLSVLDVGCSWGSTSLRLMRVLRELGIAFRYTGVDPYQVQLEKFAHCARVIGLPAPRLIVGDVETYLPDEMHDLVFASHILYYTRHMPTAVERLVNFARKAIIVHHGKRGINSFHEKFPSEVGAGPHIISTDEDVVACFEGVDLFGRQMRHETFESTADISACLDPKSVRGQNLLAFFFDRPFRTFSPEALKEIRSFILATYAPTFQMIHDVGVITVT